jgi:hypothetical protein
MEEDEVGHALVHLVERVPDACREGLRIFVSAEGQAPASEEDLRSLGYCRAIPS